MNAPSMRANGKSARPALYQTSTVLLPNNQTSRWSTMSDTTSSGLPSALAKSSGSMAVPSFSDVTQKRWLLGSLNTKYPSR